MADSKKYNGSQWEHSLRKLTTATEAVENPLYSDGTAITAYTIKGNTVQNGTPTPDNPVDANGVGVMTKNLFDKNTMTANAYLNGIDGRYLSSAGHSYSCIIKIKPNTSYRVKTVSQTMRIAFFTQYPQPNDIPTAYYKHDAMGSYAPRAFIETSGNTDTYMVVFCYNNAWEYVDGKTVDEIMSTVMISEGAEMAVPYEPYGYKIPISSASTTTPVYLGEVQTTRKIMKLVLTGTETWGRESGVLFFNNTIVQMMPVSYANAYCSHYRLGSTYNNVTEKDATFGISRRPAIFIHDSRFSTASDFNAYLAAQYAAGTPVTVWYVLTTPQTATVNEPLMKIGNYSDSLSNATAIPTTEGANSITVDTTVQPSEFTATWTGWHDTNVKEWDGSDWQ